MSGNTSIVQKIEEQHKAIQATIHGVQTLCAQAVKKEHSDYTEEFNALRSICKALLFTHETMTLHSIPGLINHYKANLKAISTKVEAIESKPKSWSACETMGEQATYIIHAIEGVIRSFLNILSFGHVNVDNQADYFFHTPHHEKPEVQDFEHLLTELNSHIEVLEQHLSADSDNTQTP